MLPIARRHVVITIGVWRRFIDILELSPFGVAETDVCDFRSWASRACVSFRHPSRRKAHRDAVDSSAVVHEPLAWCRGVCRSIGVGNAHYPMKTIVSQTGDQSLVVNRLGQVSWRRDGPAVRVACQAVVEILIDTSFRIGLIRETAQHVIAVRSGLSGTPVWLRVLRYRLRIHVRRCIVNIRRQITGVSTGSLTAGTAILSVAGDFTD